MTSTTANASSPSKKSIHRRPLRRKCGSAPSSRTPTGVAAPEPIASRRTLMDHLGWTCSRRRASTASSLRLLDGADATLAYYTAN